MRDLAYRFKPRQAKYMAWRGGYCYRADYKKWVLG